MKIKEITMKAYYFIFLLSSCIFIFPSSGYSALESCVIGNPDHGSWVNVPVEWGECIIPGPPDPNSAFLTSGNNGAFRYEGKYRLTSSLSGCGFSNEPPTNPVCYNFCIDGFAEWMCNDVYGFIFENEICKMPDWNNDGKPDGYASFPDGNRIQLSEWQCNNADAIASPTNNLGPNCPVK